MNDNQPKPATGTSTTNMPGFLTPATGEWTWDQVDDLYRALGIMGIVQCHNAALAAAKENSLREILDWERGYKCGKAECAVVIEQLKQQLAASGDANIRTNEMLTNVRRERDEAQKQLAAEREKNKRAGTFNELVHTNQQLREQLAAERDNTDALKVALIKAHTQYEELVVASEKQLAAAVEALKETRKYEPDITPHGKQRIDAALAKIKP